ncbi:HrpE/YscL family type III secretion apparatus protein [Allochromatium palmeri]|uniref:Type 3 secretion system stator protein n=1 Tax=Allochromatium palmeri TaxID=231048 RepID=A0A6N8EHX4_9GAMM|nr:HrpE/YscL family type III secretion apparatus protein [Allochromatium palmeri]MTW22499.1 HrpE/YscL family type III secretion apparatus protein [Allochromatium palmeri]
MDPFVRLTDRVLSLAPDTRLLKQADYQTFVMAGQILAATQREAEEQRAETEREQAQRLQAGYEQGLAQARLEMATRMLETVERTVDYLGAVEHRVVDLVMMSVRKVLGEFEDTELTGRLVRQSLQVVRNQPQATIRVCPAQAEQLQQRLNELLAGYNSLRMIEVVPDPRLGRGDCILETEIGVVDAGLETQLKALEQALRSRLQKQAEAASVD